MVRVKNNELCKEVLSLLEKLSNGWRRQPNNGRSHIVKENICSQLLEHYKVNDKLYLVWTIDILEENSNYIQVLKVLDILPLSNIAQLAKQLEILFESCKTDKISRCKYKCDDGYAPFRILLQYFFLHNHLFFQISVLPFLNRSFRNLYIF